ncbi:MAG: thermonuclease family protein [Mycobacteriales bacterium]|nr:thermonuclease family protein [Mycobacteriales bacterium]
MRRSPLLALLLVAGCQSAATTVGPSFVALPVPGGAQEATVVRHTDGDTLTLRGRGTGPLPGEPTKVRLLLVDTPEDGDVPECFGPEASQALAQRVPVGSTVRVTADRQRTDRFGRTLLYVWDDEGRNLQQHLLADGFAQVLVVRPNTEHLEAMRAAEDVGRAQGRGVWACGN